ncbi:hypothetical protein DSO57_1033007 [Entomophthora muscae]|uniref:Uncharacterized protein n=2 Tax=Entomophthora muscae TaxID=34485 RepID=A0ACC2S2D4_9FUNG|nr:hypothetical protein DSO57_1033007 [Entomophthora muscae]
MDRITQLQDGIDQLQHTMLTCIDYLHTRAPLLPTSTDIPITKKNEIAETEEQLKATKKELAGSFCRLIKQNEILIESLPDLSCTEESQVSFYLYIDFSRV